MTSEDTFGLPLDLGDGLTLRWATPADAEAVGRFNVAMHSDDPADPETFLYHWTQDLMRGDHPTTKADDFIVVTDVDGRIISSLNLISQTWAFDGIPFPVGRPELVATLPEFRRRGLVRRQMEIIHRKSAARGELVTAITGIPWYYRQFGYEMGLNLGGSRLLFWARPGNDEKVAQETYRLRPATAEDIPLLAELYGAHLGRSPIVCLRDNRQWHYEMFERHPEVVHKLKAQMVILPDDRAVAYVAYDPWQKALEVTELGVLPGHSWRAVARFLVRHLHEVATSLNATRTDDKQITHISFNLGEEHPAYDSLGRGLEKLNRPYAWYVRVPDVPAFLRHIAPALERRLAGSVMAGHTRTHRINLYRSRFTMVWEDGRLKEVGDSYEYTRLDEGDAKFPDLSFLQLLFGYRSFTELTQSFADCYSSDGDTTVLLDALFPRQPSIVIPFG